jgi:hypothetical protein
MLCGCVERPPSWNDPEVRLIIIGIQCPSLSRPAAMWCRAILEVCLNSVLDWSWMVLDKKVICMQRIPSASDRSLYAACIQKLAYSKIWSKGVLRSLRIVQASALTHDAKRQGSFASTKWYSQNEILSVTDFSINNKNSSQFQNNIVVIIR